MGSRAPVPTLLIAAALLAAGCGDDGTADQPDERADALTPDRFG